MIDLTIDFLKTYVTHNPTPPEALPGLIKSVHDALMNLQSGEAPPKTEFRLEDTVTDEYIVCLEDGKKLKLLKRYLNQTYRMSPEEYRAKWNLPADYPMVAKNYAEQRSRIAREQGLGKKAAIPAQ